MNKKTEKKMLGPTLHLMELVPITDPAELEAIDRRRRANEKVMRAAEKAAEKAAAKVYAAAARKARKSKSRKRK